jgi:hypothetical protein
MRERLDAILLAYVDQVRSDLQVRWNAWPLDFSEIELHEVVGALLARQVSLASNLVRSPGMWNSHMAPLILRAMADVYITLAWILKDPIGRARKLVEYGLGQAKLQIEHRASQIRSEGELPENDPVIEALTKWVESQRYMFLTQVDVGSWSGLTTREMAEEAGCLAFYRYVYTPFSSSAHSMWHHIGRLNLEMCRSPLHRGHKLPVDPDLEVDFSHMELAAKYLDETFSLFDRGVPVQCSPSSSRAALLRSIGELHDSRTPSGGSES